MIFFFYNFVIDSRFACAVSSAAVTDLQIRGSKPDEAFNFTFFSFPKFENKNIDNLPLFKIRPASGIKILYDGSYSQILPLLKAVRFESNRTVIIIWIWCSFVHIYIQIIILKRYFTPPERTFIYIWYKQYVNSVGGDL